MQNCASNLVIPWFSALHKGEGPHNERSPFAAADSLAEIVEPLAAEVCDADAEPEMSTLVSLTLMLSVNEGVETATACEVSIELGVAFGLVKKTVPDTDSEILLRVYVAVDVLVGLAVAVAVGVGVPVAPPVEVAVAVAVGVPPLEVAVGVGVAVRVAVAAIDGVAVGVGVTDRKLLPASFIL